MCAAHVFMCMGNVGVTDVYIEVIEISHHWNVAVIMRVMLGKQDEVSGCSLILWKFDFTPHMLHSNNIIM